MGGAVISGPDCTFLTAELLVGRQCELGDRSRVIESYRYQMAKAHLYDWPMDVVRVMDRWILGDLWPEQLPATAVSLLVDGLDSQSLGILASMGPGDDPEELRELFTTVASEMRWPIPTLEVALAREVGRIVDEMEAERISTDDFAVQLLSLWERHSRFAGTPARAHQGLVAAIRELTNDYEYYGLTRNEAVKQIEQLAMQLKTELLAGRDD